MLTAAIIRQKLLSNYTDAEYSDCVLEKVEREFRHFYVAPNTTAIKSHAFNNTKYALTDVTFLGNEVERLDGAVFHECYSLTNINLGILYKLKAIGCSCFRSCHRLKSIEIPASVEYINAFAFEDCFALKHVLIHPNGKLRAIMKFAFANTQIEEFLIPVKLGQIDNCAFRNTKIANFSVSPGYNKYYINESILYSRFKTALILVPPCYDAEVLEIPDNIQKLEPGCCLTRYIKKVILPASLLRIRENAFDGSTIYEIDFSKCSKLTYIEELAFASCCNITKIDLHECPLLEVISKKTFCHMHNLTTVVMAPNVHTLSNFSFHNCKNLTNIDFQFNTKLRNISFAAFSDIAVETLYLPSSAVNITNGAIINCINLTDIEVSSPNTNITSNNGVLFYKNMTGLISYPIGRNDTVYKVPDSVLSICSYAFYQAAKLQEIILPPNLQYLGQKSIAYTNITKIVTPNTVKSIDTQCFFSNVNLSVAVLNGVYSVLKPKTFENCNKLFIIHLCDSLEYVDQNAFEPPYRIECVSCKESLNEVIYQAGVKWAALHHKTCPTDPVNETEARKMFSLR